MVVGVGRCYSVGSEMICYVGAISGPSQVVLLRMLRYARRLVGEDWLELGCV